MALTANNRADWEDVFTEAVTLRDLKPWDYTREADLFAIDSPYGEETGWCMFMGSAGEVFGCIIYLGKEGLSSYHHLQMGGVMNVSRYESYNAFFTQKCLQIEFVNANELDKKDRMMHKALGIKSSGPFQAIKFRYLSAGNFHEHLPEEYLPFLADCLEQASWVTRQLKENPDFLHPPEPTTDQMNLHRIGSETKDGVEWSYEFRPHPRRHYHYTINTENLSAKIDAALGELPRNKQEMVYHMEIMTSGIAADKKKGHKAYRPLAGLFLTPRSAYAHGLELWRFERLHNTFTPRFCRQLCNLGFVPSSIVCGAKIGYDLLLPIGEELGIEINYDPARPECNEFSEGMRNNMHPPL